MNMPLRSSALLALVVAGLVFASSPVGAESPATYAVKRGDTLFGLAKRLYGDITCWPLIASIPGNHAYYPGVLWAGYTIKLPPQAECDRLHKPIVLEGAKEVSSKVIAKVADKPWEKNSNLASTYVEGQFRSEAERASMDRISGLTSIQQNVSEWMGTFNNGAQPMWRFRELTGLAEGYLDRSYWPSVAGVPLSEKEKENEAWWRERLKSYVSDTSRSGAWEERHISEYTRYLDGSHWAMHVPVMVPNDDPGASRSAYVGPKSFFVIDGKETEAYYHTYGLALMPNGSWIFRYQQPDPKAPTPNNWTCDPDKNDSCSGPWFFKTNTGSYGPYNHPTPPIPTKDGRFWYFDRETPSDIAGGYYPSAVPDGFVLYRDGKKVASYDWVDNLTYGKDAMTIVFRVRQGNDWHVAVDGKLGAAWDYVDQVQVNPTTGSVFYRARDQAGNWHAVKNEKAAPMPWEPSRVLMNGPLDEAFALRAAAPKDRYDFVPGYLEAFSKYGTWTFPRAVNPEAIDAKGNFLFVATDIIRLDLGTLNGEMTCSSSVCSRNYEFWLNDKRLGTATQRMVPLFSKSGGWLVDTKFGKVHIHYKHYGATVLPAFDPEGHLVFYTLDDTVARRTVFDLGDVTRF